MTDEADDMREAIAAAQAERDAWAAIEGRWDREDALPRITCGGVGVLYRVTSDGIIQFQ